MFSRTQNREERAPLGDALTFHQREPPQGEHQRNKRSDLAGSPAQTSHHWTSWKPGSKGAIWWGPNRPTSQDREDHREEWVWRDRKKKRGSWTQHWPASRREHSEGGQEARGRGSAYEQDLHLPQYSPENGEPRRSGVVRDPLGQESLNSCQIIGSIRWEIKCTQ